MQLDVRACWGKYQTENPGRQILGIDQKVHVVYLAADEFFRSDGSDVPPQNPDLPDLFILSVGNRKSHKNQVALIEVLYRLAREYPDLRAVFVGRSFPAWEAVLDRASELGVRDRIVDLGEVGDAELRFVYQRAVALVFPSLYEGFGLPVLEAMAAGAPVVSSARGSLAEIAGGAALQVDPTDFAGISEAVRSILRHPEERQRLVNLGRLRASEFSWQRTAEDTLTYLHTVASAPAGPPRVTFFART